MQWLGWKNKEQIINLPRRSGS